MSTNFLFSKVCWQHPLHLKHTFLPIIWIFTEGEGDGIESRLPFKIFSTLWLSLCELFGDLLFSVSIWFSPLLHVHHAIFLWTEGIVKYRIVTHFLQKRTGWIYFTNSWYSIMVRKKAQKIFYAWFIGSSSSY